MFFSFRTNYFTYWALNKERHENILPKIRNKFRSAKQFPDKITIITNKKGVLGRAPLVIQLVKKQFLFTAMCLVSTCSCCNNHNLSAQF